jgi:5-methylcytosine-specific restriction endonuclease McrA
MIDDSSSVPLKQCSKCGFPFPATTDFFYVNSSAKSGISATCKECTKARVKAHTQAHSEQIREYQSHYRETHTEEMRDWKKQHYKANKEQISKQHKAYAATHKEQQRERMERYMATHRDDYLDYHQQYYEENKEQILEQMRRHNNTEHGRLLHRASWHKRKARKKAIGGVYTAQDIQLQYTRQKGKCYWCHKRLGQYHIDHVIPLFRGGSNAPDNLVIACPTCNLKKGIKLPHEWDGSGGRLL